MASNRLSGRFPAWIVTGNFTSLQVLDLSNYSFYDDLPADYLKLSGFINGTNTNNTKTLYAEIWICTKGQSLAITYFVTLRTSFDISSNHFSGYIPEKLSELRALRYLTPWGNTFSGEIPTQVSYLQELESLDLSRNFLSGSIPSELRAIPQLAYFNVSHNFLTEAIPVGGQVSTLDPSSFQNNSNLYRFPLSPCKSHPVEVPSQNPKPPSLDSGTQGLLRWISFDGFLVGFETGFKAIRLTFLVSKRARSKLYAPPINVGRVYDHSKPIFTSRLVLGDPGPI